MKKMILPLFLIIEWVIFLRYCTLAPGGFNDIACLKGVINTLSEEINALHLKKQQLKNERKDWNAYSFYKEQVVREQLHFCQPNEIIIMFDNNDE